MLAKVVKDNSRRSRTRQMGRVHSSVLVCTRALFRIFAAGKRARATSTWLPTPVKLLIRQNVEDFDRNVKRGEERKNIFSPMG